MISGTGIGSMVTVAGVNLLLIGLLLIGAARGDQAKTEEHAELSAQIQNVEADVKDLREETRAGFESLSKQLSELNSNGSDGRDSVKN